MQHDNFKHRAKDWDKRSNTNTKTIGGAILERFALHSEMELLDFGSGTGLLGFEIAQHVKKVYGVDTSASMLEQLSAKNTPELSIEIVHQDIIQTPLQRSFDGLISSMTLHHIEDLHLFFSTIHSNIEEDGFIAIADLELEDGSFHSDNTGVFHFGFDTDELQRIASRSGFRDVEISQVNTIKKPHKEYGVFLLTATK
ncbi:MAG: methyltransferase domain-containing protein [Sulfurimonas sp.]|uniref:class I SAM-dependent DNA methyltransferase n=1 Tax=Sulfurimonas sp. TaxID=2022749 RepID=UPI0025F112E7|nr:methyltransferase domain-containing protein [Sulfurimonas sp.]MCK9492343.1 methyltransferase domain-containing protein [Sulfurimonas sp.]